MQILKRGCGGLILLFVYSCSAQSTFTRADTLRGAIGTYRTWWDVTHYKLSIEPNSIDKSIKGDVVITFDVNNYENDGKMQIDLQEPLEIESVVQLDEEGKRYLLSKSREGNVYWITGIKNLNRKDNRIEITYYGKPHEAITPPWDGGLVWDKDNLDRPYITVACQELGASVWYPCKDHQYDEPNNGAEMTIICDTNLVAVGNGRHIKTEIRNNKKHTTWQVKNPINNYNFVFYIGNYKPITETLDGIKGKLDCTFWALDYDVEKAKEAMQDVRQMMKSFEKWFGPFPWYEDGYQLVQAPFLGMEHQSAIAYGNKYKKGYLGKDLSGTGFGKTWDYIIVHESGHEWWGNNITTKDIADMWIHEGFTTYSESLFVEDKYDKKSAETYTIGMRKQIENKEPIIGEYHVNKQPTGDMYYKGANIILMIRTIMNDDIKFNKMLVEMQKYYGKKTCTSREIEQFICQFSSYNFMPLFNQYLYTNQIPKLNIKFGKKGKVALQLTECNDDFTVLYRYPINDSEYAIVELKANQKVAIKTELSKAGFLMKKLDGYYFFE